MTYTFISFFFFFYIYFFIITSICSFLYFCFISSSFFFQSDDSCIPNREEVSNLHGRLDTAVKQLQQISLDHEQKQAQENQGKKKEKLGAPMEMAQKQNITNW
jgi:hypothetical protein